MRTGWSLEGRRASSPVAPGSTHSRPVQLEPDVFWIGGLIVRSCAAAAASS
jgi:hypothetical protein